MPARRPGSSGRWSSSSAPPETMTTAAPDAEQAAEPSVAFPLAISVAAVLAVDPARLGGAVLRAPAGPVRDRWLAELRRLLPAGAAWRRIPLNVDDSRLLGGLDLTATLEAGRPVAERGLLAEADGGVIVLSMAERIGAAAAARLTATLDDGEVRLERDGLARRSPARFGVIAFDESSDGEEQPPSGLLDRLAFHLDLSAVSWRELAETDFAAGDIDAARERLPRVKVPESVLQALTATAAALGIASLRAPLLALQAARVSCALDGRLQANDDDAAFAARVVLAPRATRWPVEAETEQDSAPAPQPSTQDTEASRQPPERALDDVVLEAALASIPPGLLAQLPTGGASRPRSQSAGRAGQAQRSWQRGRPVGVRRGELRRGQRLNLVATLRAAAPWQPLRRRTAALPARVLVRPEDFRIARFEQRAQTTTIFVVDASGSAALHRLAEAKGAVEMLLADCYVRRDRVALIAFRGQGAELLLPPTRSLVRARRSLAGLPGGGGTPLAAGIQLAGELAASLARRGDTPVLILLTDGRANVPLEGQGGRAAAERDALAAARVARALSVATLLIDTSPRPEPQAERIAIELGARYLPLPHADAYAVSRAARAAAG